MFYEGQVVSSAAGHDKGGLYLVVRVEGDGWCRIADGKRRRLAAPKRKNPRHLRPTWQRLGPEAVRSDRALRRALAGLRGTGAEEEPGEE